jgi:DNA-binding IclR family transcriptional regulator
MQNILAVMDCYSISRPSLGVREVARLTEMAPSTVGKIMQDLREAGLLEQDEKTREYSLGPKVLTWAGILLSSTDLREIALPFMVELKSLTGETVSLYQLDGNERLCIERIESDQNIRMVTRIGQRLPLYAGSAGKAMLAFLADQVIQEILDPLRMKPFTDATIIDPEILLKELITIRSRGYAVSHGEWISDASGVAAPLFGIRNQVIGGLSISGPSTRFDDAKVSAFGDLVITYAGKISMKRGFVPSSLHLQEA